MHTFTSAYAAPLSFPTAVSTENSPDKPERSVQSATSVGSRKSSFSRQATSTATVAVKGQQVSVYVSEQLKKVRHRHGRLRSSQPHRPVTSRFAPARLLPELRPCALSLS